MLCSLQPIINGVAGNLVAVQASRISTQLHTKAEGERDISLLLWSMVVPGHALFLALLNAITEKDNDDKGTNFKFEALYFIAALVQVAILLALAKRLVHWLWRNKIDPDIAAIPYLTSLGDLLGGILLSATFYIDDITTSSK